MTFLTLMGQIKDKKYLKQQLKLQRKTKISNTSSNYKGVSFHKASNKWSAQIKHNDQRIHLGLYDDEAEAGRAYDRKAIELFREFAVLNF